MRKFLKSNFGLKECDVKRIINVIKEESSVRRATMFGSRAMGNFKHGSDVDIALFGDPLDVDAVSNVSFQLNENTTMPYKFDIVDRDNVSEAMQEHIKAHGIDFY